MIESFIEGIQGVAQSIAMFIQYVIHALQHLLFFLVSLLRGIRFIAESFVFLPLFFAPVVGVVLAIMVIRTILNRE